MSLKVVDVGKHSSVNGHCNAMRYILPDCAKIAKMRKNNLDIFAGFSLL